MDTLKWRPLGTTAIESAYSQIKAMYTKHASHDLVNAFDGVNSLSLALAGAGVCAVVGSLRYKSKRRSATCACRHGAEDQQPTRGSARRVVTVVHGTYGRHGKWMQVGSPLMSAVSAEDAVIHRFCWSGRNRQADRVTAGRKLNEHLRRLSTRYPGSSHQVVAHSHGGNVAMYALRDRDGKIDPAVSGVRVITLATPFLSVRTGCGLPFRFELPFFILGVLSVWTAVAMISSALFGLPLWVPNPWLLTDEHPTPPRPEPGTADLTSIVYLTSLVTVLLMATSAMAYARQSEHTFMKLFWGRAAIPEISPATTTLVPPDRLLIVRARGDEARAYLLIGQFTSWVSKGVTNLLAALSFGGGGRDPTAPIRAIAGFVLCPFCALVLLLANLPFGIDMMFWNIFTSTSVERSPPGPHRVLQIRKHTLWKPAHSIYAEPSAIRHIVAMSEQWSRDAARQLF